MALWIMPCMPFLAVFCNVPFLDPSTNFLVQSLD